MRVVVVNYPFAEDAPGPRQLLERYAALTGWCAALRAAGARVSVAQRFHRDAAVELDGVDYHFTGDGGGGDPGSVRWPRRTHDLVAALDPDVVHVNGLNVPLQTWLLGRRLSGSAAVVVQDHAGDVPHFERRRHGPWSTALRRTVRRRLMAAVDGWLFTAAELADPWRQAGFITARQPVHAVAAGSTDYRAMDPDRARHQSGVSGSPAVLWVGRLDPVKEPLTVLEAFERSLVVLPHARLTMVFRGGGLADLVRARVEASHALARGVRLVGAVSAAELPAYYSAADVFLLGSRHEACGFSLVEACACGATPVVPAIPAFRRLTGDGMVGVLWAPGDASSCAHALELAARLPRAETRSRTIAHFARELAWPVVADRALAAYHSIRDGLATTM